MHTNAPRPTAAPQHEYPQSTAPVRGATAPDPATAARGLFATAHGMISDALPSGYEGVPTGPTTPMSRPGSRTRSGRRPALVPGLRRPQPSGHEPGHDARGARTHQAHNPRATSRATTLPRPGTAAPGARTHDGARRSYPGPQPSGYEPGYNAPTTRDGGARRSYPVRQAHNPRATSRTTTLPRAISHSPIAHEPGYGAHESSAIAP